MYAMRKKIPVDIASFTFCMFTKLSMNIPFACSLTLVFDAYRVDLSQEMSHTFNKTFTMTNVNQLMPTRRAPAFTPRTVEGKEASFSLSSINRQLTQVSDTLQYQHDYNIKRFDEQNHNAKKVHRKLGVSYDEFSYPTRAEYSSYEDPLEKVAVAEEEEEDDSDDDDEKEDCDDGGDEEGPSGVGEEEQ